jgi:hypothetical protein
MQQYQITWATVFLMAVVAVFYFGNRWLQLKRAEFIRAYPLPRGLYDKVRKHRPELSYKDCALVAHALRQFFLAYLKSGRQFVSMPSQVVDDLWHEYNRFCRKAFGEFLHHSPAVVLGKLAATNEGLRRVWWFACREENINPRLPSRLPLLFALDAKLKIANGFHYSPNCDALRNGGAGNVYCGGDFKSLEFDGTIAGFGSRPPGDKRRGGGGCGGGASCGGGHGCGGSGCGGGGCGGGS